MYTITNESITLKVSEMGAEMKSLGKNGTEYLWNGDVKYWGRSAPVLFPLVGSLKNKQYSYEGKNYSMSQHGFARDMEFQLVEQNKNSIHFRLCDNEESRAQYPFHFQLDIKYTIRDGAVTVEWIVKNTGDRDLHFSLGGHPAFLCPLEKDGEQSEYSLKLTRTGATVSCLERTVLNESGLAKGKKEKMELREGILPISSELFSRDALIFENSQVQEIAMQNPEGEEYIRVEFDAPVVGIWSPAGKNAPFICIEPWYGRCDREDFEGSLEQREWGNCLHSEEIFRKAYTISI